MPGSNSRPNVSEGYMVTSELPGRPMRVRIARRYQVLYPYRTRMRKTTDLEQDTRTHRWHVGDLRLSMNDFSLLLVAFGIIGITVLTTSFARLIINTVRLFSTTRLLILKLHSTLYPLPSFLSRLFEKTASASYVSFCDRKCPQERFFF